MSFLLADGTTLEGVTSKQFEDSAGSYYVYVAGVGFVLFAIGYEPGEERLAYARINGVEYGTPLIVGSEPLPDSDQASLLVYPNPATASSGPVTLAFRLPSPSSLRLAVYDVLGREVVRPVAGWYAAGEHRIPIEVNSLPAGAYLVRIEAGAEARTAQLVVQ